jgi:peptide chain release factor 1
MSSITRAIAKGGEERSSSIIIEIRSGAGGEEAALFAQDLFKMYSKYAENQSWKIKILDSNQIEMGGLKQIIFEIKGEDAYSKMKYEGGVHRVQRVPKTEKGNRIHTSTASVAVLQVPEQAQIKINPQDLKMDFYKSSGPGGQNVNKRQTAIRITYLPTGLIVSSQTSRNLEENKKAALNILEAKLFEKERKEIENKIAGERKTQIGRAQRSEKIRTYNFPQDRITDHRIGKKFYNIEKILAGNLDPIVKALQKSTQG